MKWFVYRLTVGQRIYQSEILKGVSLLFNVKVFLHSFSQWFVAAGIETRAQCCMGHEYLMALNGAFALTAVALFFPPRAAEVELCGRPPLWRSPGECGCPSTAACDITVPLSKEKKKITRQQLLAMPTIRGRTQCTEIPTPAHPTLTCGRIPRLVRATRRRQRSANHLPSITWRDSLMLHAIPYTSCIHVSIFMSTGYKTLSPSIPLRRLRS